MKKKRGRGRPVGTGKWKPDLNDDLVAFFSREPYKEVETTRIGKKGEVITATALRANILPYFGAWHRKIGIHFTTFQLWKDPKNKKSYPGFYEAYCYAKELQKEFLITNALADLYNPASFIFTAKNLTDMKNTEEHEISGPGGIPLLIIDRK